MHVELSPKYKPLISELSRFFIVTGGRGSGKSYAVNVFALLLTFEKGQNILFTRYTMTSAYTSIIPEFISKMELLGLNDYFEVTRTEIVNKLTGSKIYFKGLKTGSGNQTAALKSLADISCWICDEAEEIPDRNLFNKVSLSIRTKNVHNRIIAVLNPSTKEHWIYEAFFEERGVEAGENTTVGDTTYIHTTYLDNLENLDDSFIHEMEVMKERRPKEYENTVLGGWRDKAEGVIFENWRIGKYVNTGIEYWGADFGFSTDPSTLVRIGIDKSRKEIYLKEELYKTKMVTSQLGVCFQEKVGRGLIIADSAEVRLIEELKRYCNVKPSIKGQGSVSYGIALMQDYDLIIDPSSTNLIKELNNYVWDDKKSETPKQNGQDHLLDAARYGISYALANPNKGNYYLT